MGKTIPMRASATTSSCLDRLTDTHRYTGTHAQRFDDDGKGRGMAGRDRVYKGHGTVREWFPDHDGSTPKELRKRYSSPSATLEAAAAPRVHGAGAAFGKWADGDTMCGFRWAQMCKECHLTGRGFMSYDVDVTFKRATKGKRLMTRSDFKRALDVVGEKRMQPTDEIAALVLARDRPRSAQPRTHSR